MLGLLGVVAFGAIHAFAIVPIWTRLLGGVPFSLAAGLAVAWARFELRAAGVSGAGPIAALKVGVLLWALLIPMTLFDIIVRATGVHHGDNNWEIIVELLLSVGAGSLAGHLITKQWRGVLVLAGASLALSIAQAGPIPVVNGARASKLYIGLALFYIVSVVVLDLVASMVSKYSRTAAA